MGAVEARVVHLDANFLVEIAAGRRAQVRQTEQWLRGEIAAYWGRQPCAIAMTPPGFSTV